MTEPTWQILSRLTHELRTPLSSLTILADMLAEQAGEPAVPLAGHAERVQRAARDALELIEELGELARLESGRGRLETENVDLQDLIQTVLEDSRAAAAERGVPLELVTDDGVPETLQTDGRLLRRILRILVASALGASEGTPVSLRLATRPAKAAQVETVVLEVADRGTPLPGDAAERLFDPLAVTHTRTRRAHGGTGAALPIAHAAARRLGGELCVRSSDGGTQLTLLLPLQDVP